MTATKYPLPDARQVAGLLGMLFDGVTVKPAAKLDAGARPGVHYGVYVADDGVAAAFCACDLAFAANAGAALSMLPPNAAREAIAAGKLGDVMLGNLREVMNICTRLVVHPDSPHARLDAVCAAGALSPGHADRLKVAVGRVDYEVGLGKYGAGRLAVLSA